MGGALREWALEAFAGYAAVDELSEGPYWGLSAVDNGQDKRVRYEVLDHEPNHDDIEALLGRLKTALDERSLSLKGITTENAVERGNRRHRKRQKSVYRVRSTVGCEGRSALDMIRESRAEGRDPTTQTLHQARRGYT
jgi:hypothetical protein